MEAPRDPLTFGSVPHDEDLDDLTRHLDAALAGPSTSGGSDNLAREVDPLSDMLLGAPGGGGLDDEGLGSSSSNVCTDPFGALAAAAPRVPQQAPLATYGQLVTPAAAAPAAPAAAPLLGADTAAPAGALHAPALPDGGGAWTAPALASSSSSPSSAHPSAAAAAAAGSSNAPLAITVSDPLRRDAPGVLGMRASHVDYLVSTRSSLPEWTAPEVAVRRRFRDFVALAEVLKAQYRGYFIPPRPEKNAVEGQRMSDAFVEERRAGLERYLRRLAAHPVVGTSEAMQVFLETQGDLDASLRWRGLLPPSASLVEGTTRFSMQLLGRESSVPDPVAAAQPAARRKDLMRAMREAAAGMRGGVGREVPLQELDLRRLREAAEEMREQLSATSRAAEKLVSRLDALASAQGDLGLALFKVAKMEEAEGGALASYTGTLRQSGGLIGDQKRAAAAIVRASKVSGRVTGRVALELGTLHDALAAMPAAIRGYMSREHQMLTWHTLEGDLEAKQKALADADRTKAKRADELRGDVARLELSIGAARAEYERLRDANLAETVRFGAERRAELGAMLGALTATQVAASERLADVWGALAAELGADSAALAAARAGISAS